MAILFRWTTPTIDVEFDNSVGVSDIEEAILAVKQWGNTIIERDITTVTIDTENNTISWLLTQAETGLIVTAKKCEIQADWLLTDGTRGTTGAYTYSVQDSAKNEVISNE